jgi:hypothetical protein
MVAACEDGLIGGIGINGAPAAFERLRDANTMKILIAPNGP